MGALTIRKLDDALKAKLRVRAARRGNSMEQEAREILSQVLTGEKASTTADWIAGIREKVEPFGGFELELPKRQLPRTPPTFRGR